MSLVTRVTETVIGGVIRRLTHSWRSSSPVSTFFNVTLVLWVIAIPTWWIQAGYRGVPLTEPFSFRAADGGCDLATEAIGNHCFSDFYSLLRDVNQGLASLYGSVNPALYPPTGLAPYVAISGLHDLAGWSSRVWLILFLVAGTIAVSVPAIYAALHLKTQPRLLVLFALGPASLPALMVLDRGNGVMFTIPLLLAFGVLAREHRYDTAAVCLALAVSQRPQFLLAFVLFVGLRQWRSLIVGLVSSGAIVLSSFLFWPGDRWQNIRNWLDASVNYSSTHSIAYDWPANLSLSRAFYQLTQLIGIEIFEVPFFVTVGFVLVVFVSCALFGRYLGFTALFALAMLSPMVVPELSYFYYLTLTLPVVAIMVTSQDTSDDSRSWVVAQVLAVASAVTLVPLPFADDESPAVVTPGLSAIIWLAVCASILVSAISGAIRPAGTQLKKPHLAD